MEVQRAGQAKAFVEIAPAVWKEDGVFGAFQATGDWYLSWLIFEMTQDVISKSQQSSLRDQQKELTHNVEKVKNHSPQSTATQTNIIIMLMQRLMIHQCSVAFSQVILQVRNIQSCLNTSTHWTQISGRGFGEKGNRVSQLLLGAAQAQPCPRDTQGLGEGRCSTGVSGPWLGQSLFWGKRSHQQCAHLSLKTTAQRSDVQQNRKQTSWTTKQGTGIFCFYKFPPRLYFIAVVIRPDCDDDDGGDDDDLRPSLCHCVFGINFFVVFVLVFKLHNLFL